MPNGSPCAIDDCGASATARGWCDKHYRRWQRHGDPLVASRSSATSPKLCPNCLLQFIPKRTTKQKFCTDRCQRNFNRDRSDKPACKLPDCARVTRAKGLCLKHYKAQHPKAKQWKRGSPETRRANLRRKTQQRRAKTRDPEAQLIDRDKIGERDGWACGICSLRVDSSLPWPDPSSASLDHVIPLSRGGRHIESNVQISHLYCNTVRGARPLEQVAC